jgi:hypothetical protein
MESSIRQRVVGVLFFWLLVFIFIGLFYVVQKGDQRQQSSVSQHKTPAAKQNNDSNIVLFRGQTKSVGKIMLIYRGFKKKKIIIDVIIPELDPKTNYRYSIDKTKAKRGFRLSQENFILISSSKSKLQLKKRNNG